MFLSDIFLKQVIRLAAQWFQVILNEKKQFLEYTVSCTSARETYNVRKKKKSVKNEVFEYHWKSIIWSGSFNANNEMLMIHRCFLFFLINKIRISIDTDND